MYKRQDDKLKAALAEDKVIILIRAFVLFWTVLTFGTPHQNALTFSRSPVIFPSSFTLTLNPDSNSKASHQHELQVLRYKFEIDAESNTCKIMLVAVDNKGDWLGS